MTIDRIIYLRKIYLMDKIEEMVDWWAEWFIKKNNLDKLRERWKELDEKWKLKPDEMIEKRNIQRKFWDYGKVR